MVVMVIVMVVAVAVAVACQCWWHFPVLHIESCILFSNSTLLEIVHIYYIMTVFFFFCDFVYKFIL